MTTHSEIIAEMERQYEFLHDAVLVGPSALAYGTYQEFGTGDEDDHIRYTSLEHFKQMARQYLGRRNNANSDDNPAHSDQSSFEFTGQLQDRYPLPRKRGEDPVYKLRTHLTVKERSWNVGQLRKSSDARMKHADALEAEGMVKGAA